MKYNFRSDLTEKQREKFAERLLQLANILDKVPRKAYDHSSYKNDCGTTACALGWAVDSGEFKGLNLKFKKESTDDYLLVVTRIPKYSGLSFSEDDEADRYFGEGIYHQVFTGYAFLQSTYRGIDIKTTPKTVAKRLRKIALQQYGYIPND